MSVSAPAVQPEKRLFYLDWLRVFIIGGVFSEEGARFFHLLDQIGYYATAGGQPRDWPDLMWSSLDGLNQKSNFRSYVAAGAEHTILPLIGSIRRRSTA
jgi:hypothetical protein